jgi:hypothetical protein
MEPLKTEVTTLDGHTVLVSTVLLKWSLTLAQRPYETMVFACDEKGLVTELIELDVLQYATEDAAVTGHQQMVDRWKNREIPARDPLTFPE